MNQLTGVRDKKMLETKETKGIDVCQNFLIEANKLSSNFQEINENQQTKTDLLRNLSKTVEINQVSKLQDVSVQSVGKSEIEWIMQNYSEQKYSFFIYTNKIGNWKSMLIAENKTTAECVCFKSLKGKNQNYQNDYQKLQVKECLPEAKFAQITDGGITHLLGIFKFVGSQPIDMKNREQVTQLAKIALNMAERLNVLDPNEGNIVVNRNQVYFVDKDLQYTQSQGYLEAIVDNFFACLAFIPKKRRDEWKQDSFDEYFRQVLVLVNCFKKELATFFVEKIDKNKLQEIVDQNINVFCGELPITDQLEVNELVQQIFLSKKEIKGIIKDSQFLNLLIFLNQRRSLFIDNLEMFEAACKTNLKDKCNLKLLDDVFKLYVDVKFSAIFEWKKISGFSELRNEVFKSKHHPFVIDEEDFLAMRKEYPNANFFSFTMNGGNWRNYLVMEISQYEKGILFKFDNDSKKIYEGFYEKENRPKIIKTVKFRNMNLCLLEFFGETMIDHYNDNHLYALTKLAVNCIIEKKGFDPNTSRHFGTNWGVKYMEVIPDYGKFPNYWEAFIFNFLAAIQFLPYFGTFKIKYQEIVEKILDKIFEHLPKEIIQEMQKAIIQEIPKNLCVYGNEVDALGGTILMSLNNVNLELAEIKEFIAKQIMLKIFQI